MIDDELSDQDPVDEVLGEDDDQVVVDWLTDRVPQEVPADVAAAVRSSMAAELTGGGPVGAMQVEPPEVEVSVVQRLRPSLGVVTVALIVFSMVANVLVAWRSDHRVAAVVGDDGRKTESVITIIGGDEAVARRISVAALFESNVSLIQRELNHERYESSRASFHERRRSTRPAEEKTPEEIPDRSGAAVRPRSGLQRVPELASFLTA
jgi:hypothetical protein